MEKLLYQYVCKQGVGHSCLVEKIDINSGCSATVAMCADKESALVCAAALNNKEHADNCPQHARERHFCSACGVRLL